MVIGTVSLMLREPLVQLRTRTWREPSALAFDTQSKPATEHGSTVLFEAARARAGPPAEPAQDVLRPGAAHALHLDLGDGDVARRDMDRPRLAVARGARGPGGRVGLLLRRRAATGDEHQSERENRKNGAAQQSRSLPGARRRAEDGVSIGE